ALLVMTLRRRAVLQVIGRVAHPDERIGDGPPVPYRPVQFQGLFVEPAGGFVLPLVPRQTAGPGDCPPQRPYPFPGGRRLIGRERQNLREQRPPLLVVPVGLPEQPEAGRQARREDGIVFERAAQDRAQIIVLFFQPRQRLRLTALRVPFVGLLDDPGEVG